MVDESTSLLSEEKDRSSYRSSSGVKPNSSINSIPLALEQWHKRSLSNQSETASSMLTHRHPKASKHRATKSVGTLDEGMPKRHSRASFMQLADGSISTLTPIEMGRHELYEDIPFLAVSGLQRKEHNLSVAFSSYAAALDTLEQDDYLHSTTGKHMSAEEKEKRMSQMSLLLLDELEADAVTVTTPLIFAVLIASMLQFIYGYNISVMNSPEPYVFPGHSTGEWSMAVAAFCVGGPFGSVLGGQWADSRGRRGALLIITWLFVFGGFIQACAPTLNVVILARAIIGLASGASSVLVPLYLGEMAPPNLRGVIGTMTQFALVIGIFFVDLVGFLFANADQWRYMFALTGVLALLQLALTPFLLESPRWLLGRNRNSAKARFIIKKLRGFRYDEEVETEVDHFVGAAITQQLGCDGNGDGDDVETSKNSSSGSVMAEMFADRKVRLLVISTLVLQAAQQLCGINAVFYYSGLFFEGVIDNPLVGTTLMGGINVIATYVALLIMDRCGRKTLIMWSSVGMFFSCVVIVLSLLGYLDKLVALVAVGSYVSFFEIGLGPIPSLIVAEMFEGKYVVSAMTVSLFLQWVCNFVVSLLFPYINETLGPYSFGPFAVVLLLTIIYAWIWLPETQGKSPEELLAELVAKNEGTVYHNMDIEEVVNRGPPTRDEWAEALAFLESEEKGSQK
ncbi:hypothetical protein ACHAWX_002479 [Stephanocyclus meneghinianus]